MGDYHVEKEYAESDEGVTFGPVMKGEVHRAQIGTTDLDRLTGESSDDESIEETPSPAPSGTWVFSPRTPEQIQANRDAISSEITGKLTQRDGWENWQWSYSPPINDPVPTQLQLLKDSKGEGDRDYQIKNAVWHEMRLEGACNATVSYDGPKVTWGRGYAMHSGGLQLMKVIFANYPHVKQKFLDYGIHYNGSHLVVAKSPNEMTTTSTKDEGNRFILDYSKEGTGEKSLIAVFILIAEGELRQEVVDAQFETLFRANMAGDVPDYARNWPDLVIQVVAHTHHWMPIWGWKGAPPKFPCLWDKDTNTIGKVLKRFAQGVADGGAYKNGAAKLMRNGALVHDKVDVLSHFRGPAYASGERYRQGWGDLIAWKEIINSGCPDALSITKAELSDSANTQYGGIVFYLEKSNSYYSYPGIENYYSDVVERLTYPPDKTMKELLKEIEKMSYSQVCDIKNNYSEKIETTYGVRVKMAVVAVRHKKLTIKQPRPKPDKNVVINDPGMSKITSDDRNEIIKYIGGNVETDIPDEAIARLRESKFDECASILNGRSMDHIVETLKKCDVYQLEQLEKNHSWTYDTRVWVAIVAVMISKRYSPDMDSWHLLDSAEYRKLPKNSDQDGAILKVLGMSAAQADEPLVKLELGYSEDCARILNGRSIEHILSTLRPVAKDKLNRLLNSYKSLELEKKYGCHVLLSTEAVLRKSASTSVKQAFKTEYAKYYDGFSDTKKKIFCDEMGIAV